MQDNGLVKRNESAQEFALHLDGCGPCQCFRLLLGDPQPG